MIEVQEALKVVLNHSWKPANEQVPLDQSLHRILAEDLFASRDFPPFDRVMMDGIAVKLQGRETGARIAIEGTHFAGDPARSLPTLHGSLEVMTGSTLPKGADTVVPVEHYLIDNDQALLRADANVGQHIHRQGTDRQQGDLLADSGTRIHAGVLGALATEGKANVSVFTLPPCTVVSTGNELVPVDHTPLPHQIRRSNVHVLAALARQIGLDPKVLHLPDDPVAMAEALEPIVKAGGVLLLSGGVSKGKKDHLPEVLASLGVQKLFHRVAQRPGKPLWFGVRGETAVFAFPGNPISATFGMMRYTLPWLQKGLHQSIEPETALLTEAVTFRPNLTRFLAVQIRTSKGMLQAVPMPANGSGDLAGLIDVDGFAELRPDHTEFPAGTPVPLFRFP